MRSNSVAQALLPFPQYCSSLTGVNENVGNSTYHSLQVKAEHRSSKGLWFLATYTFSKLLTDSDYIQSSSLANGNLGATGVISAFQRSRNKSLSIDDVPHTFNFSTLYELPFGKGKRFLNSGGAMDRVIGGWQLSTLIKISSGTPFFFRSSNCNIPAQFEVGCIPSQTGADPFLQDPNDFDPGKGPLLNQAAFQDPGSFNFNFGDGPRISSLGDRDFQIRTSASSRTFPSRSALDCVSRLSSSMPGISTYLSARRGASARPPSTTTLRVRRSDSGTETSAHPETFSLR